ncbi:LuxR family transcriptional regulator [Allosalinactinospora lopnorensis]|uniref:LuxR family transcriptional regulator n=1 Tax=Allosalinactinospora lopnorensis TaxID=1352348 RepID=UPI000623F582|nr:LuxR family transcriptional regulator [Allosalinactinospora lopnorensis]
MGDHESAWKYLNHPVPHETYNTCYGLQFLYARGHYYLATGKAEDALVGFMSCGDLLRTWRIDWPGFLPWRARAAEAEARLGNGSSARSLIEEQLSLLESERTRTWALSLRVLAEVSEPAKRPGLLKEASRILHTCGDNLELARALAALSQAHHLLGDARQARLVFRRAQEVAKKCGALLNDTPPASRRTPQPLNSEPVGPGSDLILELSDAERRVASLATQGYSNREISNRLYITTSTVEQHLTRVYRKLGISGRKDLPVDLYFDGLIPL